MTYTEMIVDIRQDMEPDMRDFNDRLIFWTTMKRYVTKAVHMISSVDDLTPEGILHLEDLSRSNEIIEQMIESIEAISPVNVVIKGCYEAQIESKIRDMVDSSGGSKLCPTIN